MRHFAHVLAEQPTVYVHHEAGHALLRASAVLRLRTDAVIGLIERYGIEEVAEGFRRAFDRPVIESEQVQRFQDIQATRGAFEEWAHRLWAVIDNAPEGLFDDEAGIEQVFNHDKGYNRAANFAENRAMAAFVAPSSLFETLGRHLSGKDPYTALYDAMTESKLIDQMPTRQAVRDAVAANWAVIAERLGTGQTTDEVAEGLVGHLDDLYLLED